MRNLLVALLLLVPVTAHAIPDDRYPDAAVYQSDVRYHKAKARAVKARSTKTVSIIGGRPAGCPAHYCGCGASIYLFGRIIPKLNLAANWLRFPRTSPAPGMVAARRGHVWVLIRHLGGNTWIGHDSNSGGRMTRVWPRSIAGFAIVNPRS